MTSSYFPHLLFFPNEPSRTGSLKSSCQTCCLPSIFRKVQKIKSVSVKDDICGMHHWDVLCRHCRNLQCVYTVMGKNAILTITFINSVPQSQSMSLSEERVEKRRMTFSSCHVSPLNEQVTGSCQFLS